MSYIDSTFLKAYYKLDEAADADAVDSHGSHTLTADGTGGVGPGSATGRVGNGRDFENASGNKMFFYKTHHADFSPGDTRFGFQLWLKFESLPGGGDAYWILGKYDYDGSGSEYLLGYDGTAQRFVWYVVNDGHDGYTAVTANNFGAASTGAWIHVLGYHDPTANKIYLRINNGTADEAAHSGGAYASATEDFCLGGLRTNGTVTNIFDGVIDEFAWFKGGFPDDTEQGRLYNSGNGLDFDLWETGPVSPPTLSSVVIQGNGNFVLTYNEVVTGTEELGYSVTTTGAAITFASGSGSGTAIHTLVPSRVPDWAEVVSVNYSEATGDLAGIATDLEDITDLAVTNNSDTFQPTLPAVEGWRTGATPRALPTGWDGAANVTVASAGDLQAALDGVDQDGAGPYIIELEAGGTYTGTFVGKNKTGSQWLIIRPPVASITTAGVRVTPADAGSMAKLTIATENPNLWFENSSHKIRLINIEITNTVTSGSKPLVYVGYEYGGTYSPSVVTQPTNIIFDRCYIHGQVTGNHLRGLALFGTYNAVFDSYLPEFHYAGADSQSIQLAAGQGPFYINNNYLEAAGENFMSGGGDPAVADLVPSDITFTNNYVKKKLSWRAADPSYAGTDWTVKNLFELKNAQRVLVEGNIFENQWSEEQAYALTLTVRNQDGSADWSVVQDVTVRNNEFRNVFGFCSIPTTDDLETAEYTKRILIEDNLVIRDSNVIGSGSGAKCFLFGSGFPDNANHIAIRHNTIVCLNGYYETLAYFGESPEFSDNFKFKDNIVAHGNYGIKSPTNSGLAAVTLYNPNYDIDYNTIEVEGSEANNTLPASTIFADDKDDVGFTDWENGVYSLASGASVGTASDGVSDRGVDWDALQAAIENTEDGNPAESTSNQNTANMRMGSHT